MPESPAQAFFLQKIDPSVSFQVLFFLNDKGCACIISNTQNFKVIFGISSVFLPLRFSTTFFHRIFLKHIET